MKDSNPRGAVLAPSLISSQVHSATLPIFLFCFTTTNYGQGGRNRTYGVTYLVDKPNFALYQLSYTLLVLVRTARVELAAF
jgi:hypothetical protein